MGKRSILIDRKPLMGKRAYKLYQYLKKTNSPSPVGEAAVLDCTVGGAVHRRTLRHLEEALVNNLVALRPGEMTSGNLADTRKYIWKLIAIGRRQVYKPNSVLVIPFLKEAFHLAEENGLVLPAKIVSETLSFLFAHLHFDEKEYCFFKIKSDYYREVNFMLQKSIICYRKLTFLNTADEEISLLINLGSEGLNSLRDRDVANDHLVLDLMEYQLEIKISEIKNDPAGIIAHASSALKYLESRPENTQESELAFFTYLGYSYLLTNNYEKGTKLIDRLLNESGYSSHNFGKMSELKVLLSLRTGHYQEASEAYFAFVDALSGADDDTLFERSNTLFQSYLYLLISLGALSIDVQGADLQLKKLRFGLERLRMSTDNIDVNHYHFISLIEQIAKRNHRKAREHWRALAAPKKSAGIRYKYFYTLLSILFEQGFHRMAVDRHAAKYLKKMRSKPFAGELTISLEEVIPYEELWQLVFSFLENKRIRLR
jgi:tetratricopeptide (TPR) repeat protein